MSYMTSDLIVTPQQFDALKRLAHELSADCWSESKWLEGMKRILGRKDIACFHDYGPTWASVRIEVEVREL